MKNATSQDLRGSRCFGEGSGEKRRWGLVAEFALGDVTAEVPSEDSDLT